MITRPALRYYGSKWRLAPWIISHMPGHDCYVEPYGGAAAVLLQKPESWLEVYNDLDSRVVNFFRVLRDQGDDLIRAIELTPFSLEEFKGSDQVTGDAVEDARRFYVRGYQSIAGATATWPSGWRRQKVVTQENGRRRMTPAARSFAQVEHLMEIVARLKKVGIDHEPALDLIRRYDGESVLFYCDPPYVQETRGRWKKKGYRHEMTDDDHRELASLLHQVEGKVMLSGYDCELYEDLYRDWRRLEKRARVNTGRPGVNGGSRTESLWFNPQAEERQMTLWEEARE